MIQGDSLWMPQNVPQWKALLSQADEIYYGGSAGGGKMLDINSGVYTPFGLRTHKDLEIGSQVCNPDGSIARVIKIQDYHNVPLYRVTFVDGASVLSGLQHNWLVKIASKRMKAQRRMFNSETGMFDGPVVKAKIMTTEQLIPIVEKCNEKLEAGKRTNWPLIPLTSPITFTKPYRVDMRPIDPYVLGVLLGDGSLNRKSISITTVDLQMIADVADLTGVDWMRNKMSYRAKGAFELRDNLEKLGLLGHRAWEKFIPESYKYNDIDSRWSLLQGLMDTDGTADSRGHCSFCSTSEQLALDVQWLARGLGFKATISEKNPHCYYKGTKRYGKKAYDVYIQGSNTKNLFRLERKRQRCKPFNGGYSNPMRRIVSIEYERRGDARCISVDHPNSLYLTDGFIVTHNSDLALGLAVECHQRSLILRRESTQLRALIERSREIIDPLGRLNELLGVWHLNNGKIIELSGCKLEKDKKKFQGRPHDLIVFDEAPEFLQSQVEFIIGWLRTEDINQRTRIVYTGNPPMSIEGEWIVDKFSPWIDDTFENPAKPGEIRYYVMLDDEEVWVDSDKPIEHKGETLKPRSRTYVPSSVDDNPYYADTDYKARLQALPEPLRSLLLHSDFKAIKIDNPYQVIPTFWVELAQKRWKERQKPETPMSRLGVDVARGGRDKTVLCKRYDNWIAPLEKHDGQKTPDGQSVAALTTQAISQHPKTHINIDVIGWGSSAYDILVSQRLNIRGINFAESSNARDKSSMLAMTNKRSEYYWRAREALDPIDGDDLAIPDDRELKADLTAPRYKITTRGVVIESKEDIKKRLGRSTDCGDAFVLSLESKGIYIG